VNIEVSDAGDFLRNQRQLSAQILRAFTDESLDSAAPASHNADTPHKAQ
jgi:hypothetical protein